MANRREVPSQFKAAKGREVESTKALYDHSNKILLLSYVPNRNKNVLMMSYSHSSTSSRTATKNLQLSPITISIKEELTLLMEIVALGKEFSCLRITNRWPMVINYD